ncbi:MAG: hypothetical protein M3O25_07540 [Actinomycetota bacterium]|nr:hypothetical protein [Actinomycetota bacterium]
MPITGYEGGEMADREARAIEALRKQGVSVEKVHRIWEEEDHEGAATEMVLFVSEAGRAMTGQVWPTGEAAVEEGW